MATFGRVVVVVVVMGGVGSGAGAGGGGRGAGHVSCVDVTVFQRVPVSIVSNT